MAHAPKSECCCSISVHTGAKIAAWISIICSILMGVLRFPLGLIGTLINAIICGMLIYGVRNQRPNFYLPYLILAVVSVIFQFVSFGLQFADVFVDLNNREMIKQYGTTVVVLSVILFLIFMVPVIYLFVLVPYRSFKLVKYDIDASKNPPLNAMPTAPPSHYP